MTSRLAWLALALLPLLFTACGEPPEAEDKTIRTLTFASPAKVNSLDPSQTTAMNDFRLIDCLFEGLVQVNPQTLNLEPGVAERWEVSEDGMTYTFHLRENAKWSNGDPVIAADFEYGWFRAILPDYAAKYTNLFDGIAGVVAFRETRQALLENATDFNAAFEQTLTAWDETVGIETPDDHTLIVQMERPVPFFLQLASFGTFHPIHQASYELHAEVHISDIDGRIRWLQGHFGEPEHLVTNGPYQLSEYKPAEQIVIDANEHYWGRQSMGNDRIIALRIETLGNQIQNYIDGEIDFIPNMPSGDPVVSDLSRQAREGERNDIHTVAAAGTYFYRFNCMATINGEPNPFADARVRRAFSLAIDRQSIVERVTQQREPVATTLVPPGSVAGYDTPTDEASIFNPERAAQLLDDAGYADRSTLPRITFVYNNEAAHERAAQAIQQQWQAHLGVRVELEGIEWGQLLQRLDDGDFMIGRAGWFGDYQDPTTWLDMFRTEDGNNDSRYSSARYDELLAQASIETDPAARFSLLREAEALLMSEAPVAPIYHYQSVYMFDPDRVKNVHPNSWNNFRLDQVTVEPFEPTDD